MLKRSLTLVPVRRQIFQAKLGLFIFLAGTALLFFSAMASYAVIRVQTLEGRHVALEVPGVLWGSLAVLVGISGSLHWAVWNVVRERQKPFRMALLLATIGSFLFFSMQLVGMMQLMMKHEIRPNSPTISYAIAAFLAFLHLLHVLGGIGFLCLVLWRSFRGVYDHEKHWAVDNCANYWHFLDLIWIVLLAFFVLFK